VEGSGAAIFDLLMAVSAGFKLSKAAGAEFWESNLWGVVELHSTG
jgi:hypothetical protein